MKSQNPATLYDAVQRHAETTPQRAALIFLDDTGEIGETVTYEQLVRRSSAISDLVGRHCQPGDRVALSYPHGSEFVAAFLGCTTAGAIAVPLSPPRLNRPDPRFASLLRDAAPRLLLGDQGNLARLRHDAQIDSGTTCPLPDHCLATDSRSAAVEVDSSPRDPVAAHPDDVAFLQYTSGSTSTPRGVIVTHANLLTNIQAIKASLGHSADTVMVSWLPMFHDMGLIGNTFASLVIGFPCVQMSPMAFIKHPLRWLKAVTRHRATCIGAPDFAYALCAARATDEDKAALDLSSLELAYSGAEPVRYQTMMRFHQVFAECGFRYEAFYPCYGLAEATLLVSGGAKSQPPIVKSVAHSQLKVGRAVAADDEPDRETRVVVGCGTAADGQQVLIVDPDTSTMCAANCVGEIWVAGPIVTRGYWKNEHDTRLVFDNRLAGQTDGHFLRTGDLGFMDEAGELFITGRMKDVIIQHGQNYYPQDLERAAEQAHTSLRYGRSAAFAIEQDEERVAIVLELDRRCNEDPTAIAERVRATILRDSGLSAHYVVVARSGSVPMTTSGKIQRRRCKALFLSGELDAVTLALSALAPLPVRSSHDEMNHEQLA